jgi:hypothetical protein
LKLRAIFNCASGARQMASHRRTQTPKSLFGVATFLIEMRIGGFKENVTDRGLPMIGTSHLVS